MTDATVFVSSVRNFSKETEHLSQHDYVLKLNSLFIPISKIMSNYNGIFVKTMSDILLGFFSGSLHQQRALDASLDIIRFNSTINMNVSLDSGPVFYASLGGADFFSARYFWFCCTKQSDAQ